MPNLKISTANDKIWKIVLGLGVSWDLFSPLMVPHPPHFSIPPLKPAPFVFFSSNTQLIFGWGTGGPPPSHPVNPFYPGYQKLGILTILVLRDPNPFLSLLKRGSLSHFDSICVNILLTVFLYPG